MSARLRTVSREAWAVVAMVVIFIVVTAWWLAVDTRPPNNDGVKHMQFAWEFHQKLSDGDLTHWFETWTAYPPLLHLVLAIGLLPFGPEVDATILLDNLIFVPLLALGVYNAGRIAFGRTAGLIAAAFALSTPMIVSQFHAPMVDPPLAAMVAVSVWLLLASNRFAHRGYSVAAGVALGLGMLTKAPFPLFVGGLILVLVARGGWRHWINVAMCGALVAVIAGPWYLEHYGIVRSFTAGATANTPLLWYGDRLYPDRWSEENFTWYAWAAVNTQYYVPLLLFFAGGVGWAARRMWRDRRGAGYEVELLAGGVVAYLAVSYLRLDDPRYSLPALVYVATLAAAGLVALRGRLRTAAIAAFAAVCVINFGALMVPVFEDPLKVTLPGAPSSPIGEREFMLFSSLGYGEGTPDRDYRIEEYLGAAHRDGVRHVATFGENAVFNIVGPYLARNGLDHHVDLTKMTREDMVVEYYAQALPEGPGCTRLSGRYHVYFRRGDNLLRDRPQLPLYCPET